MAWCWCCYCIHGKTIRRKENLLPLVIIHIVGASNHPKLCLVTGDNPPSQICGKVPKEITSKIYNISRINIYIFYIHL